MTLTITEALAEIKTIGKRLETKRQFVCANLARAAQVIDPFASEGGSVEKLRRENQAISDLEGRIIELRRGIAKANESTNVTVCGVTRTIAQWLTWRKEVAGERLKFLNTQLQSLRQIRQWKPDGAVRNRDGTIIAPSGEQVSLTYNADESAVTKEVEFIQETLGTLDGQLSLKNATVMTID